MKQSRTMITEDEDTRIALNVLARHETIYNLYRDILIDMMVCEIEGWDKLEYLKLLKDVIAHFERKVNKHDNSKGISDLQDADPSAPLYQTNIFDFMEVKND